MGRLVSGLASLSHYVSSGLDQRRQFVTCNWAKRDDGRLVGNGRNREMAGKIKCSRGWHQWQQWHQLNQLDSHLSVHHVMIHHRHHHRNRRLRIFFLHLGGSCADNLMFAAPTRCVGSQASELAIVCQTSSASQSPSQCCQHDF